MQVVNGRWEVAATLSDGQFTQVSFVNSICTYKGGTHVMYIADQLGEKVVEAVNKKNKAAPVKLHQAKNHIWVFINCLIENPTFDSQTKENMTLRASAFGSKCELSDDFHKKCTCQRGVQYKLLPGHCLTPVAHILPLAFLPPQSLSRASSTTSSILPSLSRTSCSRRPTAPRARAFLVSPS